MNVWIHSFDAPNPPLGSVGGKGLNLSRLWKSGAPVPPGFVLTTDAYHAFVAANGLEPAIRSLTAVSASDNLDLLERRSQEVGAIFEQAPFPVEMANTIRSAYEELCRIAAKRVRLAVRSSAIGEDAAARSFAGMHETSLNVEGADLLDKIKLCWASLWSARALDYRLHQQVALETVAMAVVVQELVPADASGVLFTANPVTGARDEAVVNAAWGLGEALVGGQITPDNIVVDKGTAAAKLTEIGEKCVATVSAAIGVEQQQVPEGQARLAVLNAIQLQRLVKLGCKIETDCRTPQDIEWCRVGDDFWILQSRPITALPPEPERWEAPADGRWVHGGGAIELLTEPVSPLLETFFVPLFDRALREWMTRVGLADALTWPIIRGVNGFMYACLDVHLRPRHIWAIIGDFREHMRSMQDWPGEVQSYQSAVAELSEMAPETATGLSLYAAVEALLRAAIRYWIHVSMIAQPVYRAERRFIKFYLSVRRRDGPPPEVFLRGLEMRPIEAERSVYDLATHAEASPGVAQALLAADTELPCSGSGLGEFRERLAEHLQRFGHQIYSFDPLVPTLSEDPRPVFGAVQAYLGGKESPDDRLARLTAEREVALSELQASLTPSKYRKLQALLDAAQGAGRLRENALFELGLAWKPVRRYLLELGKRMFATHAIRSPDEVFWLTRDELSAAASQIDLGEAPDEAHDAVAQRRLAWHRRQGLRPPYILPEGSKRAFWWKYVFPVPELSSKSSRGIIRGLGVSPGRVTSVARVIRTYAEIDRLCLGEILVAHTTTPAWTPLFARAAGLVTDLGGPLAHGSIVAREYGIPAVMGTGSATFQIKDGQLITVDGARGCVYTQTEGVRSGP